MGRLGRVPHSPPRRLTGGTHHLHTGNTPREDTVTKTLACCAQAETTDSATLYIDTATVKAWGVDEDGLLWVETTEEGMATIGDCATTLVA